jgi:stearoyl-CoA desaturase (delta-9 desaturase)
MSNLERRITITAVVEPFLAFLVALCLLWGGAVSALDVAIFAVMYALTGFGVTIGFHLLLTHRAFTAPTGVRAALAILGSMAVQGAVIHWVADHRKHHAFADEDGDSHSPSHITRRGLAVGAARDLALARRLDAQTRATRLGASIRPRPARRSHDRLRRSAVSGVGAARTPHPVPRRADPVRRRRIRRPDRAPLGRPGTRLPVPPRNLERQLRLPLYGNRPFQTDDRSRNNWAIAVVALGEGWHHNHHAFPTSARHGLLHGQLDPSYALIRRLERLGITRDVCLPTQMQIAAKRVKTGPTRALVTGPDPRRQHAMTAHSCRTACAAAWCWTCTCLLTASRSSRASELEGSRAT